MISGASDKHPSFQISMLNSIETNKLLISKSYTEFKEGSPSIKLLSKSYSHMNRSYLDDLARDEKSLYDYDTVRKLLSDMESKNEASRSLAGGDEAAAAAPNAQLDEKRAGNEPLSLLLAAEDAELENPGDSDNNQYNFLFQDKHDNSCSNNTSYAELPSIRSKSPNKCDDSMRHVVASGRDG